MNLIEMSLAASILIIGIVLFRSLFVHRIPKKVMLLLWGIVILRLVFPTSIPLPFPQEISLPIQTQPVHIETAINITETTDFEQQAIAEYSDPEVMIFTVELAEGKGFAKVLPAIYLLGVAIMLLGSVYLYIRDGRFFRESLPMGELERKYLILQMVPGERERKFLERVDFRFSDRTATPVTYGVFKPAIVFPKGIFLKEEKEIGFCLLHELVHIRNHDNLRKLIVHGVLCIHWFNPFVWIMYFLLNRDIELLCDETAIRKCRADRQDYALALLSLAERRAAGFRTALGFGKNAVKERILAVMSMGKATFGGVMAAVFAVALSVIMFLSSQAVVVTASAESAAEYTITASSIDDTDGTYMLTAYSADVTYADMTDTLHLAEEVDDVLQEQEAVVGISIAGIAKKTEDDIVTNDEVNWASEVASSLPDDLINSLVELEKEFAGMGLQVKIGSDDYQLYFKGVPVYFFADNRNLDEEKFSGRVYAREAGNENGDTGVETVRDEDGEIIGLKNLSVEESRELAKAWTGYN